MTDSILVVGDKFTSVHFVNLLLKISSNDRIFVVDDCKYDNEVVCENNHDFKRLFELYNFNKVINFTDIDLSEYNVDRFLQVTNSDIITNVNVCKSYCYGPGQSIREFLPYAIVNAMKEEPIIVSNEFAKYDMLYVDDFCDALYKIMHFGDDGSYNVSSGFMIKEVDIAKMLLKKFELPLSFFEYSNCDVQIAEVKDNRKVVNLGWRPKIEFEDGLDLTINWYKKNIKSLLE
jgi:hypothetical protein